MTYKQCKKIYKRKYRFNPHYEIYIISIVIVLLSFAFMVFKINKFESQYMNLIISNEVYKNEQRDYVNARLEECVSQIELSKISKQAHDEADKLCSIENTKSTKDNVSKSASVTPSGHSFKSYTYYTLLSSNSPQGKLQQSAYTDENGLRKVGDYYCVALGSYYGKTIGDKYIITLSTGVQIKVILCDVKADRHTDANNQYTLHNGCMVEFYVDMTKLNNVARRSGNISSIAGFEGDVVSIVKE